MQREISDFRSDTVTRPTPAMRRAMAEAEVGDDVFGDDPTVQRLEARVAEMLGKEAALFVASGTMSNLIAVGLHCKPGDEFFCDANCHIYHYEQAGYAQLNGVAARPIEGSRGLMTVAQLSAALRPVDDHFPNARMLALENTHNRAGGAILPLDAVREITSWAGERGLATHLDGARLFNAAVATGVALDRWAAAFDTVSVCFSKSLGAPVGSALAGPKDLIAAARRRRKVLGGGMRQAGVIAAGALHALENHIDRLADDHARAKRLATAIDRIEGLRLDPPAVDTNLIFFQVDPAKMSAAELCERLRQHGVWMLPLGVSRVRAVAHLDVGDEDIDRAIAALNVVVG